MEGKRLSREKRREQIKEIALKLFVENGYSKTTMDEIIQIRSSSRAARGGRDTFQPWPPGAAVTVPAAMALRQAGCGRSGPVHRLSFAPVPPLLWRNRRRSGHAAGTCAQCRQAPGSPTLRPGGRDSGWRKGCRFDRPGCDALPRCPAVPLPPPCGYHLCSSCGCRRKERPARERGPGFCPAPAQISSSAKPVSIQRVCTVKSSAFSAQKAGDWSTAR